MKRSLRGLCVAAIIGAIAVTSAGCENSKNMLGALVGAGTGAAIGSQIGSGTGQLAAAVVGTLAGTMIGTKIAENLNYEDRAQIEGVTQTALEHNKPGVESTWKNPDKKTTVMVRPGEYVKRDGTRCREFEQVVVVEGEDVKTKGTACRKPDGKWRIVHASN